MRVPGTAVGKAIPAGDAVYSQLSSEQCFRNSSTISCEKNSSADMTPTCTIGLFKGTNDRAYGAIIANARFFSLGK